MDWVYNLIGIAVIAAFLYFFVWKRWQEKKARDAANLGSSHGGGSKSKGPDPTKP